jgi:hypothetical protein
MTSSEHLDAIEDAGFRICHVQRDETDPETPRKQFAEPFSDMSDEDAATRGVFVVATKDQ